MDNFETLINRQISLKQEIDNLPDGERYAARQRWMMESIELLLRHAVESKQSQVTVGYGMR